MNVLGMGPAELLLVLALALIVFGPDKLPDIARQVGRTVGELRRMSSDVTREIQRSIQEEPSGSGPRIAHQPPRASPPPPPFDPPPAAQAGQEPTSEAIPSILPPANGGGPIGPPTEGSWEEGSSKPASPEHGPRPTA
jgi:sec-independent protein translocase protein TatA